MTIIIKKGRLMSDNTKRVTTYIVTITSLTIISSWFAYIIFFRPPKIKWPILELSIFEIYPPPEAFKDYNYPRLLTLLEEHRQLSLEWGKDFYEFTKNEKNKIIIDDLINKLKEENHLFNKYYRNLRFNRNLEIPESRRKSLLYYSFVIENSIKELQDLSNKFNCKKNPSTVIQRKHKKLT